MFAGKHCVVCEDCLRVAFRDRDTLRARVRDDDRGGTLAGGTLYMLDMLLLSAGLGGDGVLKDRPRWIDLISLLSKLSFFSGSLFSACRVSRLGRGFDAMECFRTSSVRETLCCMLPQRYFRGMESTRLGSVNSRMSERGRVLAQEDATEYALGSPKPLLTMPPESILRNLFASLKLRKDVVSDNGRGSEDWPLVDGACDKPDPFSNLPAISDKVIAAYCQLLYSLVVV